MKPGQYVYVRGSQDDEYPWIALLEDIYEDTGRRRAKIFWMYHQNELPLDCQLTPYEVVFSNDWQYIALECIDDIAEVEELATHSSGPLGWFWSKEYDIDSGEIRTLKL